MRVLLVILVTLGIVVTPAVAEAHTLKIDGPIGVTLHIDPNDQPIAGQTASLVVSIADSGHRFNQNKPDQCACQLLIKGPANQNATLSMVLGNGYATLDYNFNSNGVWQIQVSGTPQNGGTFQPFAVNFSQYVSAAAGQQTVSQPKSNDLRAYMPVAIVATGMFVLFLLIDPLNVRKDKKNEKTHKNH